MIFFRVAIKKTEIIYVINRLLIKLIDSMQKIIVTPTIHARCHPSVHERAGSVNIRVMATRCVSGSTATAIYWKKTGSSVSGKNVPEKSIIGVINKNEG